MTNKNIIMRPIYVGIIQFLHALLQAAPNLQWLGSDSSAYVDVLQLSVFYRSFEYYYVREVQNEIACFRGRASFFPFRFITNPRDRKRGRRISCYDKAQPSSSYHRASSVSCRRWDIKRKEDGG